MYNIYYIHVYAVYNIQSTHMTHMTSYDTYGIFFNENHMPCRQVTTGSEVSEVRRSEEVSPCGEKVTAWKISSKSDDPVTAHEQTKRMKFLV